jgi:hypothetical protein
MTANPVDRTPIDEPLAELERRLIAEYLAKTGHDLHTLMARTDPAARALLLEATRHASQTLSEVEARAHYVRRLHGED